MKNILTTIIGTLTVGILVAFLISTYMPDLRAQSKPIVETSNRSKAALQQLQSGLKNELIDQLAVGRSFFTIPWVTAPAATRARDGLGPLFNANACVACHQNLGGGAAVKQQGPVDRSIVFVISPNKNSQSEPAYGKQLAINAVHGVPFEAQVVAKLDTREFTYTDGDRVELKRPQFSLTQLNYGEFNGSANPRRTPALIGLGLIEQIPEAQILVYEDSTDIDNNGISGKARFVWSYELSKTKLGRFGWKASSVSTIEQSAKAALNDMGLTSKWFPEESCLAKQKDCIEAYRSSEFDLPYQRLLAISEYLNHLRLPETGLLSSKAKLLFKTTGCQACHRSEYQLLDGSSINPYSDFLLHDMGDDLADSGVHKLAREWRTAPLWGVGIARIVNPDAGFLHDGRATTLEQAILWHGGEAEASRQSFTQLSRSKRQLLINFLENL